MLLTNWYVYLVLLSFLLLYIYVDQLSQTILGFGRFQLSER